MSLCCHIWTGVWRIKDDCHIDTYNFVHVPCHPCCVPPLSSPHSCPISPLSPLVPLLYNNNCVRHLHFKQPKSSVVQRIQNKCADHYSNIGAQADLDKAGDIVVLYKTLGRLQNNLNFIKNYLLMNLNHHAFYFL